jgi:hypothetical protein
MNSSSLTQQREISSEIVHQILRLLLKINLLLTRQILEELTDRDKDIPLEFLSSDCDCIEAYHDIISKICL